METDKISPPYYFIESYTPSFKFPENPTYHLITPHGELIATKYQLREIKKLGLIFGEYVDFIEEDI